MFLCLPDNSKEEPLKVTDVSSLWIEILHSIFEYIKRHTDRRLAYPCSLRLDGQTHLLPPLSTIVLCKLILLTLNNETMFLDYQGVHQLFTPGNDFLLTLTYFKLAVCAVCV